MSEVIFCHVKGFRDRNHLNGVIEVLLLAASYIFSVTSLLTLISCPLSPVPYLKMPHDHQHLVC